MLNKIAVIGDYDSVLGFKTLGMDIYPITNESQARDELKAAVESEYVIIYITEQFAAMIVDAIDEYKERKLPSIVPVPTIMSKNNYGMNQLRDAVKKAVGADILNIYTEER